MNTTEEATCPHGYPIHLKGECPDCKSSVEAEKTILTESERASTVQGLRSQTEFVKNLMIKALAKEKRVGASQLLLELRNYAKSQIKHPERAKHYHRTSIENFGQIVQDGALLSRTEIKKRHPERKLSSYSSSDSVMMTRELNNEDNPGTSRGVVFVLGPELIKQDTYDAISHYPTVDHAPLGATVETVLVDDNKDIQSVQKTLADNNLTRIQVQDRNEWLRHKTEPGQS